MKLNALDLLLEELSPIISGDLGDIPDEPLPALSIADRTDNAMNAVCKNAISDVYINSLPFDQTYKDQKNAELRADVDNFIDIETGGKPLYYIQSSNESVLKKMILEAAEEAAENIEDNEDPPKGADKDSETTDTPDNPEDEDQAIIEKIKTDLNDNEDFNTVIDSIKSTVADTVVKEFDAMSKNINATQEVSNKAKETVDENIEDTSPETDSESVSGPATKIPDDAPKTESLFHRAVNELYIEQAYRNNGKLSKDQFESVIGAVTREYTLDTIDLIFRESNRPRAFGYRLKTEGVTMFDKYFK
jgi:hypothetical protein